MTGTEPSMRRAAGGRLRLSTVWAVAAFVLPVTLVLVQPLGSVDLGYVVRAGDVMLRTGDVLRTDFFLFTARCEPWANQQWAAEVALAGVFNMLGWLGLALVRAGLAAGVVAFIYAACRANGACRRAAAWLTLLTALLLMAGLSLRAQLFGVLFFAALLWILARRHRHPNSVFLAVPLLALWANVHGSFPFGIFLLLAAAAEDWVVSRESRRTLVAAVLSLAATALTPFGPSVWGYVVALSTNPVIRNTVDEWQPPWRLPSYSGVVFFASVVLAAVLLRRNRRTLPWPTLVGLGFFLILAVSSTRAVYWWGMILPVTLARLPWARRTTTPDPCNRANLVLVGVLVAIPIFAVFRWLPYPNEDPPPDLVSFAPLALTSELRSILLPGEAFKNPQAWGSWFELSLPGHPVFVDSRFELMPAASLQANHRIANAEPGWERDLDALPVRVLVVNREREPRLVEALASSTVWERVYGDAEGLIFIRQDRAPPVPAASCKGSTP